MLKFVLTPAFLALAACSGGHPAYAAPACQGTRDDILKTVQRILAEAPSSKLHDYVGDEGAKLVKALDDIPPADITFDADEVLTIDNPDGQGVSVALMNGDCVVFTRGLPKKVWDKFVSEVIGAAS